MRDSFASLVRLFVCLSVGVVATSCSSTVTNRDPIGEPFPEVVGTSLDGEELTLPADLGPGPKVLLVGYLMDAQFDLDRWILGLVQLETPARIVEVPTIRGMLPGLFAGRIDDGMRSGIPNEDWSSVVTVYRADASRIVEMTGNQKGRNARVLLVDDAGVVRWFHDRGYSAGHLQALDDAVRALPAGVDR